MIKKIRRLLASHKNFLFLLLAIAVSTGVEWSPYYVGFLSRDPIIFAGRLQEYRVPCTAEHLGKMICADRFLIPRKTWQDLRVDRMTAGLGIALPATSIRCTNPDSTTTSYGDNQSRSQAVELFQTYQVKDIYSSRCTGDLEMLVWAPDTILRYGYVGAPIVISTEATVKMVRKAVEFFTAQTYFLFATGMIICFVITATFLRPFVAGFDDTQSEFDEFSRSWCGFAFFSSGAEMIIPVVSAWLPFVRIQFFFSIVAHSGPVLRALSNSHHTPWILRIFLSKLMQPLTANRFTGSILPLHLVVVALMFTPFFIISLTVMAFAIVPLYLWSAYVKRESRFFFFAICVANECGKLINVRYLPYGNLPLAFTFFIVLDHFIARVAHGGRVVAIMNWSRSATLATTKEKIAESVQAFSQMFNIRRATFIEPNENGQCAITQNECNSSGSWEAKPMYRSEIPPAFAYVLTTGSALVNVSQESELAIRIRGNKDMAGNYSGSHFSVYPFLKDATRTGAIAFTNYDSEMMQNPYRRMEFEMGMQFLLPFLGERLWSQRLSVTDNWYKKSIVLGEKILSVDAGFDVSQPVAELLQKMADEISQELGAAVFIGRVHSHTRAVDLKILSGFSEEITRRYQETQFYAVAENVKGPMALAVNEKVAITVPDISWIMPHLTNLARQLIEDSMAKSAAALPIFVSDGAEASVADSSDVWGFMWIESLQVGAFNEHQIPGLRGITSSLGSALSRHLITTRAQEALNGIPRAEVKQKLLSGLPVRENSEGYLVIADIRGSSGIANIYGAVVWYELISCLEDVFTELCKSYGLTYQFVIWDAFHFTIDEKNYRPDTIEKIVDFANEVNALIEYAFSKYFVAIPAPAGGARARFCIEFGDNTRDIRAGVWTVVGAVMANCSKLESACKHLSGWFFLSDSFSLKRPYEFEVLHEKNPATQRHIVSYLKKPNLDTCSDGIKKSLDDLINAKSIVAVAEQLKLSAEKSEKKAA